MVRSIFLNLAQRWRDENDLSDVTWAMMKSSSTFCKKLMDFFEFPVDPAYPIEPEREQPIDTGRPDFTITNGDRLFVVENKLNDRNYHIEQYWANPDKAFSGRGLITNHALDNKARQEVNRYRVKYRTWYELKQLLEQQLNDFLDEERVCVQAYLTYVQEVCSMVEIRRIDLTSLQSLYHLHVLLKQVLEGLDHRGVHFRRRKEYCGIWCSGDYYDLSIEGEQNKFQSYYPWVGVYFKDTPPSIYFAFRYNSDATRYERWKGAREDRETISIVDEKGVQEIQMVLKPTELNRFSTSSLDDQKQLLANFAKAVVDEVYVSREPTCTSKSKV